MGNLFNAKHAGFNLAWEFTHVLSGQFTMARAEAAGKVFPIVGPLAKCKEPPPIEGAELRGPFLYVLVNGSSVVRYIGVVTQETAQTPLYRWTRKSASDPRILWTHGTNLVGEATVAKIARGITAGEGPFRLYFSNYSALVASVGVALRDSGLDPSPICALAPKDFIKTLEHALIFRTENWNGPGNGSPPKLDCMLAFADWLLA
ncbi:MAG: hypothetical protein ING66_03330 [Rhodocyclaceae bacterium]|nr:hypothetical protein [Rhodocyclaceae bacterium]MCA3061835.1 hypothetical protein [Rhodocyclaceae bacterium]MCA3081709.1 hypothetical protein [Rhodocyclaceae bacterium]